MGLDEAGVAPATIDEQLELIWKNLKRILQEADMTTDNIVQVRSFLGDRKYAQKNQDARLKALGDRRVPTTAIVVDIFDPAWFVEVEILAAA